MELNGQNLRYSSPSYSETQQAVERVPHSVSLGHFTFGLLVGVGVVWAGGLTETELNGG